MKSAIKWLLPLINILILIISWILIYFLSINGKDTSSTILEEILNAFGAAMMRIELFSIAFLVVLIITIIGSILSYYSKKRSYFIGFRTSLLINLLFFLFVLLLVAFE